MLHVPHINILGPITDALHSHLGVSPSGLPRGAPGRPSTLSKQYFKRIEAVEFTIKQDDGALPKNLIQADIVLVGVSRTSKTPLSTYMAQKGYKVPPFDPLNLSFCTLQMLFSVSFLFLHPVDQPLMALSKNVRTTGRILQMSTLVLVDIMTESSYCFCKCHRAACNIHHDTDGLMFCG
jgi:hypothetical protein